MICPCKGCVDRTITCHGVCKRYQEWKAWKDDVNRNRKEESDLRQLSRDHEMKYRKNLKQGRKRGA